MDLGLLLKRDSPKFILYPAEPCNQDRETLRCKAAPYLALYCSQRPALTVETSQSRISEGGLQTTLELCFGLLFLFVGFFHDYHALSRSNTV